MSRHIPHSGSRLSADENSGRAHCDGVRWANANTHVANYGSRHTSNEDGGYTRTHDWAANVRDRRRCYHGAGVHVGESGSWRHFLWFLIHSNLSLSGFICQQKSPCVTLRRGFSISNSIYSKNFPSETFFFKILESPPWSSAFCQYCTASVSCPSWNSTSPYNSRMVGSAPPPCPSDLSSHSRA